MKDSMTGKKTTFYNLFVGKNYAKVSTQYVEYADEPSAVGVYRGKMAREKAITAILNTGKTFSESTL